MVNLFLPKGSFIAFASCYKLVRSGICTSSVLHYTQGIIREATVALLEDMKGHWISDLLGGCLVGVNECGFLDTAPNELIVEE